MQGSPQAALKAECMGVVWLELAATSIDSLPTSKLTDSEGIGAALPRVLGRTPLQCGWLQYILTSHSFLNVLKKVIFHLL